VTITDGSALLSNLTTVSLTDAGTAVLTGNALVNVSVSDNAKNVTITNTTAGHSQNLTLTNVTAGTIADNIATTVKVVGNGTANSINLSATSATALNISGSANFTDSGAAANLAATAVVTATGTGSVKMNLTAGQSFVGGSGASTITITGNAPQIGTVTAGSGTADKLILSDVGSIAATGAAKFVGFESFQLNNNAQAADLSTLVNSTFTSATLNGTGDTLSGLSATTAANITYAHAGNDGGSTFILTGALGVGQLDTLHITANDGSGAAAIGEQTLAAPLMAGVETFHLTASNGVTVSSLTGATALTAMNIDGSGNVSVTTGALPLNVNTVIDAHAVTGTVLVDASAAITNAIGLKIVGSATANNTLTGNTYGDTLIGGNGNDTISNNAGAHVVNNVVTEGNGNNSISLIGTADSDTITAGNGFNTITAGSLSGTVGVTVGTGSNIVTFGGTTTDTTGTYTLNIATGHVASAGADFISVGTAGTAFAAAPNLVVTGAVAGDVITLAGDAGATLVGTGLTLGNGTITATATTGAVSNATAIGILEAITNGGAHQIAVGVYNGNTFIVESNLAGSSGTHTTVIEIVGVHTFSAAAGSGNIVLAS